MTFADRSHGGGPIPGSETAGAGASSEPAAAPRLDLEVIAGNAPGALICVEDELVIGRHATETGQLSQDSEISPEHARITRETSGDYAIEDLGSTDGTFVNGLRIDSPQLLRERDSIEVGATTLVVRSIPSASGAATSGPPPAAGDASTIVARTPPSQPDESTGEQDAEVRGQQSQLPPLTLRLEVDFETREARIALGEGDDALRFVVDRGRWRHPKPEDRG